MTGWLWLSGAILSEVAGTLALRAAAHGRPRWYAGVTACYLVSFVLLTLALRDDVPLGAAYGVWAATGVALAAVASRVLFREPLTLLMGSGIAVIAAGVLLIEVGAAH